LLRDITLSPLQPLRCYATCFSPFRLFCFSRRFRFAISRTLEMMAGQGYLLRRFILRRQLTRAEPRTPLFFAIRRWLRLLN